MKIRYNSYTIKNFLVAVREKYCGAITYIISEIHTYVAYVVLSTIMRLLHSMYIMLFIALSIKFSVNGETECNNFLPEWLHI